MKIDNPMAQALKKVEPDSEFKHHLEWYLERGFSVFPLIAGEKEPAIDTWKPFQEKKPTKKDIQKWFYTGAKFNIAVVCGQVSGDLVVLDFEDAKVAHKIFGKGISKETLCVKSGSGKGLHVYFFSEYGCRKFKISELALDVQGEGSYVATAPSLHPSGKTYKIVRWTPVKTIQGDFEEWLYEKIKEKFKDFNPTKHRQPVDVAVLLEGVPDGRRNQATIWLATWYRRSDKTEEETTKALEQWNLKNDPPMEGQDLQGMYKTIQKAFSKEPPYQYKYVQSPESQIEIEQFTKEEEEAAEKILASDNILPYIEKSLEEIVMEVENKVSLALLEIAEESVYIGGESAAGKNNLVDGAMQIFPKNRVWKIMGTSDKSLRYLHEQVGTIYLTEWQTTGIKKGKEEMETTAQFDVKLWISEGEFIMTVVEKDPETKRWTTKRYVNRNIKNFLTTSTDVDIARELKNRMWLLTIDESAKQTELIKKLDFRQRALLPSKRLNREPERKIMRLVMKKVLDEAPNKFIIPFMMELEKVLPDTLIRTRRDKDKLAKAIEAAARLHYKTRCVVEDHIVCMPQDFYYAMMYMREAIIGTFTDQTQRFWNVWKKVKRMFDAEKRVNANNLMKILRVSRQTSFKWLNKMEQAGLITKCEEPAKGRKAKIYYMPTSLKPQEGQEIIEIDMQKLFEVTEKWFKDNANIGIVKVVNIFRRVSEKSYFRKKIQIPKIGFTIATILHSLEDAPSEEGENRNEKNVKIDEAFEQELYHNENKK